MRNIFDELKEQFGFEVENSCKQFLLKNNDKSEEYYDLELEIEEIQKTFLLQGFITTDMDDININLIGFYNTLSNYRTDMLPIMCDCNDAYICIGIKEENFGKIYISYIDYDEENEDESHKFYLLAENFLIFFIILKSLKKLSL